MGIVLSGDSRMGGTASQQVPNPNNLAQMLAVQNNIVISDATEKVFLLYDRFGVGSFGDAILNNMPVAHHIEQFQTRFPSRPPTTQDLANNLLQFFQGFQIATQLGFTVAGYDSNDPWLIIVDVKNRTTQRINIDPQTNQVNYGVNASGDPSVASRLLSQPQFNPLFQVMNLQDAVDFSRHLIRSTIDQMRFEPRFATVGGPIDTLVVTNRDTRFLNHKSLKCA